MLVSSFLHICHPRLCDLTVVLAEGALWSCISKTSVSPQQRALPRAAGAARARGGTSGLPHCFGVVRKEGASPALGVPVCAVEDADFDLWYRTCSS